MTNLKDKIKIEIPKREEPQKEEKEIETNKTADEAERLVKQGFTPEMIVELNKIQSENLKYHHNTFSMIQDIQSGYMSVFRELIKLKEATLWKTIIKVGTAMLAGAFIYDQWANIQPMVDKLEIIIEKLPMFNKGNE